MEKIGKRHSKNKLRITVIVLLNAILALPLFSKPESAIWNQAELYMKPEYSIISKQNGVYGIIYKGAIYKGAKSDVVCLKLAEFPVDEFDEVFGKIPGT